MSVRRRPHHVDARLAHARYPRSRRQDAHSSSVQERLRSCPAFRGTLLFSSVARPELSVSTGVRSIATIACSKIRRSTWRHTVRRGRSGSCGLAIADAATCEVAGGRSTRGLPHFGHSSGDTIVYTMSLHTAQSCHRNGGATRSNRMAA